MAQVENPSCNLHLLPDGQDCRCTRCSHHGAHGQRKPAEATADDRTIFTAWSALRETSAALTAAQLGDDELGWLCSTLEREQAVIMRTPASTAAQLAIKLRCVLEALVDGGQGHAAVLSGGMPDAEYIANADSPEQMLWFLLQQVEAGTLDPARPRFEDERIALPTRPS